MNDITGVTPASFEPTIDYVVTKIPRFTFEKFPGTDALLTTSMKSVGEAMAIGRTFTESLQKGLRSMETGLTGLNAPDIEDASIDDVKVIRTALTQNRPDRILLIGQAFRLGLSAADIHHICKVDPWFLEHIKDIIDTEATITRDGIPDDDAGILKLKKMGFSDARMAELSGQSEAQVTAHRLSVNVRPVYKRVDTCAAEFASQTPYMYSAYEGDGWHEAECEADPSGRE